MAIKYKWLAERLELMVEKNIQNNIPRLPTEQELCRRYHVSRQTVRMALSLLEQKGLIEKKQGSGCYLTGRSADPRENVIGILLASDREYLYPGVIDDIKHTLLENGFTPRVFVTDNCVLTEREILLTMSKKPLRGLIAEGVKSALPNPNIALYRHLIKADCRIVFLHNYYPALPDCPYIKDDNYAGSALLVKHLAAQGHTRIGGIFKADDMQGIERYQGFLEAMLDLDLPVCEEDIRWYGSHEQALMLAQKNTSFLGGMVKDSFSKCSAIVCYNDLIAYHLVDELLLAGYQLPSDMAVAAFDGTYLSTSGTLGITSLFHAPHEIGTKAACALIKKLSGSPVASQEIRFKLIERKSTQAIR